MSSQHSPSIIAKPEFDSEVFDFWGRECLGEWVSDHVICRAIDESNFAIVNYPAYEVKMYIDVLSVGVILMVFGEGDHGFIIREKHGGCIRVK